MAKTRKTVSSKIIAGLKSSVEETQQPKPEYERIADRVLKATQEFNDALKEAHQCAEMRVFLGASGKSEDTPMQLQPQIYKLTHSTMVFAIKYDHANPADTKKQMWQQIKILPTKMLLALVFNALKR